MKRKPSVSVQAKQPVPPVPAPERAAHCSVVDRSFPYWFPVLLLLGMTVQTTVVSLLLAVLALVLSVGRGPMGRFASRLSVPVLGFLAFLILCLAAGLYSGFGSYAYSEYAKLLASGSLGLLLLSRGRKEQIPHFLWGFCAVCAVIALLCIDSACRGPLFRGFAELMASLGTTAYQQMEQATYTGARFDGIYGDANLTGSLMALAIFAGLYLIRTGETRVRRLLACFLTGLSAVAFLTAMSRGAILCFAVAAVVYLLCAGKGERLGLFFTMLCLGISMAGFGMASIALLSRESFLGTLLALPCGVVLWLLDEFPGRRAAAVLGNHVKVMVGTVLGLVLVAAAGMVLAFTLTKPFVFTEDNFLYRGVDVTSGETYTFTGDWDQSEEVVVEVYGATREQELLGETTIYYRGPLGEASFTVPEGVDHVLMQFRGPAGLELRSVSLSDGTTIPMAYTLLPESIASRLQKNLLEDNSFLLRVQYVKDGWALFLQSPLTGHGLGSTEGLLTSVQPFFYESLYVHNHLLQIMDETGLLGLVAFLALMGGVAWLLLRRLRGDQRPLWAALLACLVMMNLHGLMEISFSVRMFQCAAFFLVLLPVVGSEPSPGRGRLRMVRMVCVVLAALWLVVSAVLLGGSYLAQREFRSLDTTGMSASTFLDTMEKLDRMDAYTDQDSKVNLMLNALQQGGSLNEGTASRCARELRATGDFDACYKTAAYYYLPLRNLPEFFACVQEGLMQERSNEDAWISAFDLYRQAFGQLDESSMEEFVSGVVATGEQMDAANAVLIRDVELDQAGETILTVCRSISEQQLDAGSAYGVLQAALAALELPAE